MHLRPERLRSHAAGAADLAHALEALGPAPGAAAERIDTERIDTERIDTVVRRARRELAEIEAALRGVAADAEAADEAAVDALRRVGEHP